MSDSLTLLRTVVVRLSILMDDLYKTHFHAHLEDNIIRFAGGPYTEA